jgi:hypothetical protein
MFLMELFFCNLGCQKSPCHLKKLGKDTAMQSLEKGESRLLIKMSLILGSSNIFFFGER